MGTDITSLVEVRREDSWQRCIDGLEIDEDGEAVGPFNGLGYGAFAFLAGVRNYWGVPVIDAPRGLPGDAHLRGEDLDWWRDGVFFYEVSWLTLAELTGYDYDTKFRPDSTGDETSVRDFLGPDFFRWFDVLAAMGAPGDVRVIMGFDT